MPRNQTNTQTKATGAAAARVAKPRTARDTASRHSKAVIAEAATVMVKESAHEHEVKEEVREIIASLTETPENPLQTISRLAYGFWQSRSGENGDALTDWVHAEEEYRRNLA